MSRGLRMRWIIAAVCLCLAAAGGCRLMPVKELTKDDIPSKPGTSYTVWQSAPGAVVPVEFDLEGPWDFSKGPKDLTVKSMLVEKTAAAGDENYPQAQYAEKVLPSESTDEFTIYNFTANTEDALNSYGQSATPGPDGPIVKTYDIPEHLLKYPAAVGASWRDKITVKEKELTKISVSRQVVARGQVTVPAGTFYNCFMIRVIKTVETENSAASTSIMYIWYAPDVGPVAAVAKEMALAPDVAAKDQQEHYKTPKPFEDADYMFRLKEYKIAD